MAKVLIAYKDKYTGDIHYIGEEVELTAERQAELAAAGIVEATKSEPKPAKVEEPKKTQAKAKPAAKRTTKATKGAK